MPTVLGTRTTTNVAVSPTNKMRDVSSEFVRYQPYRFPISTYGLLNKKGAKVTFGDRSKFEWMEKDPILRETTQNGAAVSISTSVLTIDATTAIFRVGDMVFFPSTTYALGQVGRITAISTLRLTISKIIYSGQSTTWTDPGTGATIRILASAHVENYTRPSALSNTEDPKSGYCQIMLDSVQLTGRQQASKPYTGKDWPEQIAEKVEEFRRYKEEAWVFNPLATDNTSADVTTSVGLKGAILTNVTVDTGTLDTDKIDSFLQTVTQYDDGDMFCFCGAGYFSAINKALRNATTWNVDNPYLKVYGLLHTEQGSNTFLNYKSPFGNITYFYNPVLKGTVYTNTAAYVNPKHLKFRYTDNDSVGSRRWRVIENVQDLGTGSRQDMWLSDEGMQFEAEKKSGWHIMA